MGVIMNISKYTGFFHDGTVHDISHVKDKMRISMESAELLPAWNKAKIPLSKYNRMAGYLHLEDIKSIQIDEKPYTGILKKTYDSSEVYDLTILENKVILLVQWINYPPKPREETDVFTIEIEAKKIYWENIPSLFDTSRNPHDDDRYLDKDGNPVSAAPAVYMVDKYFFAGSVGMSSNE